MNTQGRRFFADTSQSICILSKSGLSWPVFETFVELFNSANATAWIKTFVSYRKN